MITKNRSATNQKVRLTRIFFTSVGTPLSWDLRSIFANLNGIRDFVHGEVDELQIELIGASQKCSFFRRSTGGRFRLSGRVTEQMPLRWKLIGSAERLIGWLNDLEDRRTEWLVDSSKKWMDHSFVEWLTDWLSSVLGWLTVWRTDLLVALVSHWWTVLTTWVTDCRCFSLCAYLAVLFRPLIKWLIPVNDLLIIVSHWLWYIAVWLPRPSARSLAHSYTHSLTHLFTHTRSLIYSPTQSLDRLFKHPLNHFLNVWIIGSLVVLRIYFA